MTVIPPASEDADEAHPVKRWPHQHAPGARAADTVVQSDTGPLVGVTPGPSFPGIGQGNYSVLSAPPDTVGAAGDAQYVQWVNTAFAVFNKSTGAMILGPAEGNTLWQGFAGRCATDNSGDPIVMYDKMANRWIMTQFAVDAQPYLQCIAVSTTSDATGTYRRFEYAFSNQFNDYPKGGVWPDAYYISFNMFSNGQTFSGSRVCAFDRVQMLTANGTPRPMQCFQLSTTYAGLLPSDLDGAPLPPAGAPNYHLAFDDVQRDGVNLWKFHVDWSNPANSTFAGPTKISGAPFTEPCNGVFSCIPQPGTSQKLDSLGDRLMYRLAYRNFGSHESLVVNHSVSANGVTGVRWYEIRNPATATQVFQQGTFAPDSTHRWMGSIAQDKDGNMLLGYSASSTAIRPSIRFTGRLAEDTPGTLQAETEIFAGSGSQLPTLNRWGDYSAMTIDPVDDCTFWYTTEYLPADGKFNWRTHVAAFKFPSCGDRSPDFSLSPSPSVLTVQQGASGTSTITVTSQNGFNAAVSLSASGLPSGVTASFSPNPVTPPGNGSAGSTLTLSVAPTATLGTSTITVGGSAANVNRATTLSLTVKSASASDADYDPTLKAPKCATVASLCDSGTLVNGRDGNGPEPNQPNTINNSCDDGRLGTYHVDESNDRIRVSTVDGTRFAPGKEVRIEATVWADPRAFTQDRLELYYAANAANPTWTLITTIAPPTGGAQTLSATYKLPAGDLQAVRAGFRYLGSSATCHPSSYDDHDDLIFAVGDDTTSPTVTITAPANGAVVTGTTTVSASAADDVGVTQVEFYVDDALKSTDMAAPYSFEWDTKTASEGSHSLRADASDGAGNKKQSQVVSVTADNAGPATSITAPADGATVSSRIVVTASATDANGVQEVRFYVDGVRIGTDVTAPYSFEWDTTAVANGSHSLSTEATDTAGNVGRSGVVRVTVDNDRTPPTTSIVSPAEGSTVSGVVSVTATAADANGVLEVRFYVDGVRIGTDASAPYSVDWDSTTVVNGLRSLSTEATDTAGNIGRSSVVRVTVTNDRTPPMTSIVSPVDGSTVNGIVSVMATATDDVGVTKVEFYVDSVLKETDMVAPYSFNWDTAPYANGRPSLQTKAYDAAGKFGESAVVRVNVVPPGAIWKNLVGVETVSPGTGLRKTAGIGWNAGAVTVSTIAAGDGYASFRATETNTYRMIGLSSGDSNQSYTDIDFAIYVRAEGTVEIYEAGLLRGGFGPYASGDRFKVEVASGRVRYLKNDAVFYTSTVTPTYPLLVDTSFYSPGATIADVELVDLPEPDPGIWKNLAGVVAVAPGNGLRKTAGVGWNAGAVTVSAITAGDGYASFRATETNTYRMIGLSYGDSNQSYTDIDFAIYVRAEGAVEIYEAGLLRGGFGPYASGDRFKVEVASGRVRYLRNDAVFYTSTVAPTYPLLVDTSFYSGGATIADVELVDLPEPDPGIWMNLVGVESVAPGNGLRKTAGTGWNAGAVSQVALSSGDVCLEFRATETNTYRLIGLSMGDMNQSYSDIDFAIYVRAEGTVEIYEAGMLRGGFGSYASGDRFRVEAASGRVRYFKNGVAFYTSPMSPSYPLLVDTAFYSQGATIDSVTLTPGSCAAR